MSTTTTFDVDPVELFVEEYRDPSLNGASTIRLMHRLTTVAAAIGASRVRSELLPIITQHSFYTMPNDEALTSLGRQLFAIYDLAGGAASAEATLSELQPVFESLLAEEEVVIRTAVTTSLSSIIGTLPPNDVANLIMPVFKRGVLHESFTSRAACAALAPALATALPTDQLASLRGTFASLCSDETPMVRRAAALTLPAWSQSLAAAVSALSPTDRYAIISADLYPVTRALSIEDHDTQRCIAPPAVASLTARSRPADFTRVPLPLIDGLADDVSWRVRQALAAAFGKICEAVVTMGRMQAAEAAAAPDATGASIVAAAATATPHPSTATRLKQVLDIHLRLLEDSSSEVRATAISICPDVAKACLGIPFTPYAFVPQQDVALDLSPPKVPAPAPEPTNPYSADVVERLLKALVSAADSPAREVRLDLVPALVSLGFLASPENITKLYTPLLLRLCVDEAPDVRGSVVDNLELVSAAVGPQALASSILPSVLSLSTDTKWRVRVAVIGKIGFLAGILGAKAFERRVQAILLLALSDHVHTIRQRACEQLTAVTTHLGFPWVLERLLTPALTLFDKTQNYLHRMTSLLFILHTASAPSEACPDESIARYLLPTAVSGAGDDVANVRVAAARCLAVIVPRVAAADPALVSQTVKPVLAKNAQDSDRDVAYFSSAALALCPK